MGLSKEIILTVKDYEVKLNRDIKFYENDTIDLCFSILEYGIEVKDGVAVNKLMPINALRAYMLIETPQGVDYAESTKVENNRVVFNLGNKYSQFIGIGKMQIVIKDNDGCRVTLPEFPFEIRESINSNWDKDITVLSTEENEVIIDEFGRKIELKKISDMEEANILPIDSYSMILDNNKNKKIKTNLITQKIENDLQLVNEQLETITNDLNYVTPEMFGAVGDGVTDDSLPIELALKYNEVKFNRNYRVTKGFTISSPIHIYGDGKIFVEPTEQEKILFKIVNTNNVLIENISIESERTQVEAPAENHTRITNLGSNVCGIWLEGTENITVTAVKFKNTEYDIRANFGMNKNIVIKNCVSKNSSQCIYAAQLKNSIIDNYMCTPAIDLGIGDHCIYLQTDKINNVIIKNCTFIAPDNNFGTLIRLSNKGGELENVQVINCKLQGGYSINSYSITNKFINCEFTQTYNKEKYFNGVSGVFDGCKISSHTDNSKLLIQNKSTDHIIFNRCDIGSGTIQLQAGKIEINNSKVTTNIYTSGTDAKELIFTNNFFIANSSNYLVRCSDSLSSIIMNNIIKANNFFTNYTTSNIAVNNIYTGNIPDNVVGGQNINLVLS